MITKIPKNVKKSTALDLSTQFAVRILNLFKYLTKNKREYVLSKQILRSGTSIGANIHEAQYAVSTKDFLIKMQTALKENSETEYWLFLLKEGGFITEKEFNSLNHDAKTLLKILISITKTTKEKLAVNSNK